MPEKPTTRNLYQRMLSVADEAGAIVKDVSVTGFGGGYKGTSHDAVVKAVRESCVKHGVMVLPSVVEFEETEVTFTKGGTAYKITVTMDTTFVNAEDGTDRFTTRTVGIGVDSQDKGPGKAMSYAKKYALMMAFLMTTGDNDEERQDDQFTQRRAPANGAQNGKRPKNAVGAVAKDGVEAAQNGVGGKHMTLDQSDEIVRLAGNHVVTAAERERYTKWAHEPHSFINAVASIDRLKAIIAERTAVEAVEPDEEWTATEDAPAFL